MDEPCSALDPIATEKIEDLINELKENYAIVMVTHSMSQAARVSQRAAYFHLGNLIEVNDTEKIFNDPEHELTKNYISTICWHFSILLIYFGQTTSLGKHSFITLQK